MNKSHSNATPKIVGSLIITAIVLSGAYVFLFKNDDDSNTSSSTTTSNNTSSTTDSTSTTPTTTPEMTNPMVTTMCNNGTYTASATYEVPKSSNSIQVQITLNNDIVVAASATHQFGTEDNKSLVYTQDFDSALSGQIVGRKVDEISLSRVGGASLTTDGFNTALTDIIQQAKS